MIHEFATTKTKSISISFCSQVVVKFQSDNQKFTVSDCFRQRYLPKRKDRWCFDF